jgi:hypothetical protein
MLRRIEIIVARTDCDSGCPKATEWITNAREGTRSRIVGILAGMTVANSLRVVSGYTDQQLTATAHRHPETLSSGSVLALRR